MSSVWRISAVSKREKRYGYHPTQKPLRLVRRALLASTRVGDLVFDPFCGSGTTGVAAKELDRFFVGAELEEGYAKLAGRRIRAAECGRMLREISERLPAPPMPSRAVTRPALAPASRLVMEPHRSLYSHRSAPIMA
jgi:hypothetical protein